jgi:hypothetical protein
MDDPQFHNDLQLPDDPQLQLMVGWGNRGDGPLDDLANRPDGLAADGGRQDNPTHDALVF